MVIRLIGAVAAGVALARPSGAPPPTARYRIDQTLTQNINAKAAGQGNQTLTFSTASYLTVSFADSAGGRTVRVVLDSIIGDSAVPIPSTVFDSARGAEFRAYLTSAGKLSELEPMSGNLVADRVQGFLADFFPWVKAGVKTGELWADTTAKVTAQGADSVVVRRIRAYRVMGKEPRDPRKALRIASTYNSTVAGSQPTPSGPAHIEGKGQGTGSYLVSPDGEYLGGEWHLESALTITGAFANDPLPITVKQSTKVTPLK